MKQKFTQKLIQLGLIIYLLSFSLNGYTQNTFTVVCDKTDNTVKVVESDKRSPNYVPIKGGFPFRQIAQKWIDENYSTTFCDPGQIMNKNNEEQNQSTPVPSNVTTNQTTSPNKQTLLQPRRSGSNSTVRYKNTSFMINARFSNLGEAFNLSEKLIPGFETGIEQIFGKKIYLGTGINVNFYFSDFDEDANLDGDTETIYFFKIPVFVGYRTISKKIMVMYEVGVSGNTEFIGTPLVLESYGKTASKNSFDFLARMKVGTEKAMLELGTNMWLTETFEHSDFNMSSVYLGLRFNF